MKIAVHVARILFAIVFVFFGANGFLHFLPEGFFPGSPPEAEAMLQFLRSTFLLQLLCLGHLVPGLKLFNRYVPLGLALLFPQIVTVVTFYLLLDPALERAALAYLVTVLYIFLAYAYRAHFRELFYAKADPAV